MTEREKEALKYKDYPEGSIMKRYYDSVYLSFGDYLKKYYQAPDLSRWSIWQKKYLAPAFEESRHEEMIKNFGYVSIDKHDFKSQYSVYEALKLDSRLDYETSKFIGFLAGADFFEKYKITVQEWFDMKNWSHLHQPNEEGCTINEILKYPFGINMLKTGLPQMPYWKR